MSLPVSLDIKRLCRPLSIQVHHSLDLLIRAKEDTRVRSLTTTTDLERGTCIVRVPRGAWIDGHTSARYVQSRHRDGGRLLARLHDMGPSASMPSRDTSYIVAALALARLLPNTASPKPQLDHWAQLGIPQRAADFGTLLSRFRQSRNDEPLMQVDGETVDSDMHSLVPQSSAPVLVASPKMRASFFNGKDIAISQAKQRGLSAAASDEAAFFERLRLLSVTFEKDVIWPLAPLFATIAGTMEESAADALQWAHAMARSRTMSACASDDGVVSTSIIPGLDLINHSLRANVRCAVDTDGASVITTRRTSSGEELVWDYSREEVYVQDNRRATPTSTSDSATRLKDIKHQQRFNRPLEADDRAVNADCSPAGLAEWAWRFGFLPLEAEAVDASVGNWAASITDRVAAMTDSGRQGRPTEFVVGVPVGAEEIARLRARLQTEKYGGRQVFPPQRMLK